MSNDSDPITLAASWESGIPTGRTGRQRRGPASNPEGAAPLQAPQPKVPLPAPYEFLGELGRGGMGVVYLAMDPTRQRQVAIKFLNSSQDGSLTKRFQREAQQLARLQHPNIVAFLDSGYFQKQNYIVMEYVDGGSLRSLLAESEAPLTLQQALELFAGVADGLEYIHAQGLVHRDLKPDNILLTPQHVPKIGDFGLALKVEDQSRITQSGMILGTFSYVSPEQILSRDVGPSADLYALGCCLYEAITGRPLFSADTEFALLNAHLRQQPIPPRQIRVDIPAELDTLVLRLLQKQPGERPETAAEVARQLRRLQQTTRQVWTLPVLGRDDLMLDIESALRPCLLRKGVAALLTAPSGGGRTCVARELAQRLRRASIAVHTLVPLPYGQEPAGQLYLDTGGSAEIWLRTLSQQGPEAAAQLLWKQLESLGPPRLLVIDDLLRMPAATNSIIEAFCAQAPLPGFGWLLSCASHRAQGLKLWGDTQRFELGPLEDSALRDVAQLLLSGHLDDELSEGLLFRAAGSVRRMRLWVLALLGGGLLQRSGQLWQRDVSQPWPESLWEPLWLNIGSRSESELKLLRTAGLLEEPFPYALALELSELDEQEAHHALDLLLRDGLLEECFGQPGELFQLSSRELKEKLQTSATERLRRRVYGRAAHLLESKAPAAIIGKYLRQAGNDAEALPRFLQAALEAEQAGDFLQADAQWNEALQVQSNPEVKLMALTGRSQALLRMRRLSELSQLVAPELETPLPESAELRRTRRQLAGLAARARWMQGEHGPSLLQFCQFELGSLAEADYSDSLWLSWCCAAYHLEQGDSSRGIEYLGRVPTQELQPAPYYSLFAALLRLAGRPEEGDALLRRYLEGSPPCTPQEECECCLEMAQTQAALGQRGEQPGLWLDRAAARAHEVNDLELLAQVECSRGLIHEAQLDLGTAVRSYQRVLDIARPDSRWRFQGFLQLGIGLSKLDRLEDAQNAFQQGLNESPAELCGDFHMAQGSLAILHRDWEAARESFASAERCYAGPTARLMRCWCCWHQGDRDIARSLLESVGEPVDPCDFWLQQRVLKLIEKVPEPWPTCEDGPWILQAHPLRACLSKLSPQAAATAQPAPVAAQSQATVRVPAAKPKRRGAPIALAGLLLAGFAALAWRQNHLPQPGQSSTPAATSSPAPLASASPATSPSAVPSATPTVAFVPPTPGKLLLQVTPARAQVRLDGRPVTLVKGRVEQSLAPGDYHLEVRCPGYRSDERELALGEGEKLPLRVELEATAGSLEVITVPAPARVYLDGSLIGKTLPGQPGKPLKKDLVSPGSHTLKVVRDGYLSNSTKLDFQAGQVVRRTIQLQKKPESVYQPPPRSYQLPPQNYVPQPRPYYPPAPPPPSSGSGSGVSRPDGF